MARKGNDSILLTAAALGALTGMRSMAGPMLLTQELSERPAGGDNIVERFLASEGAARLLTLMAGGEMLADKSPAMPDRTDALPLAGRAVIGSLTAAAFAIHRRHSVFVPAAVGAASAVVSTFAAYHARRLVTRKLHVPQRLMGLMEDAVVVALGKRVARAIDD